MFLIPAIIAPVLAATAALAAPLEHSERPPAKPIPPAAEMVSPEGCSILEMVSETAHGYTTIDGTSNCHSGLISYQIYRDGTLRAAGSATLNGYVFTIMEPDSKVDGGNISMTYTIQEW